MLKSILLMFIIAAPSIGYPKDILAIYQSALEIDPRYLAAKAARNAGVEKENQARAHLLPSLVLSGNAARNSQDSQIRTENALPRDVNYKSNGWTLQITQSLFRWKDWISLSQSELSNVASEVQLRDAGQELILGVAKTYCELYLSNESLKVLEIQKIAVQEQLAVAQKSYEAGTVPSIDVQEAQSRLDMLNVQELFGIKDVLVKRKALNLLAGFQINETKRLKENFLFSLPVLSNHDTWIALAEEANFNVKLAEINFAIASRERDKQRAEHLPTVDLVANRGRALTGNNIAYGIERPGTDVNTTTIGIQVTIPLYSGGLISSKEREAVALREKALFDMRHAKQMANLAADQAFLDMSIGAAQVSAYESNVKSSKSMLSATKIGYEIGVRVNIDVLNSQTQYFDVVQKLNKARVDVLLAGLRLKAAVGRLTDSDVSELAKYFE